MKVAVIAESSAVELGVVEIGIHNSGSPRALCQ